MAHTIVMVPEGHTVQVHPPGSVPQPALPTHPQGIVSNPMGEGAKAAMDTVMPAEPKAEKPKAKKPEAKSAEKR